MKTLAHAIMVMCLGLGMPCYGQARPRPNPVLNRVGFDQRLGSHVPADVPLIDEAGRTVRLGDFLGKKPVILVFVYLRCPMLCGQELEGLTRCLRAVGPSVGDSFDVLTVSFDPNESSELAAAKKQSVLNVYDRPRAYHGWHFLTGSQQSIERLTQSVGFRYSAIEGTQQFAHAAGIVILAPDGTITRYFFGIDYPSKNVQASLENAARTKVEAPVAKWLMLCYDYDPATGRYTLAVMRLVQVLAGITLVLLVGGVATLVMRDRRRAASAVAG
jgi:protein SCO1/2